VLGSNGIATNYKYQFCSKVGFRDRDSRSIKDGNINATFFHISASILE
jgi:hypothetical protein